jgi:hypothetical protein
MLVDSVYYNIYLRESLYFFGTVEVQLDKSNVAIPPTRAIAYAQHVLDTPGSSLVAIMSTRDVFLKRGI